MAREIVFAFRADIRNLQRAVTRVEKELGKLSKAQRDAASSSKVMGGAMGGAVGKAGALGAAVTGVVVVFDKLAGVASVAGRVAAGALGAAGRAAADVVSTFARFEQTQLAINATMDTTAEQSRKVQNSIIGLGIKTQFTITAVQKAALALAQLGATDKDLEGLLKVGTDIATLTLGPLERETEILLKTMKAFGVEGRRQAEIFGTVFIQAHTKSAATVRKLGESLKSVGRIGRQFGNEIQDIVPAISKMIDEGQEAETTGIILRTVFTKLIAPTVAGEAALRKMGLSLARIKPSKVNKLNDVLATLAEKNLSVSAAAKIFGRRFAGQIVGLTELARRTDGAESKLDQFRRTLLDSDAAQRKVRRTQRGLQFELDQLNASWVAFKITTGGVIARLFKMEGRFLSLRKRIGAVLEDLSKLSDDELQEITIKLLSPDNLQKMWKDALRSTLPAIGAVIQESFLIGLRTMIKAASVIGTVIGRAYLRSIISDFVSIVTESAGTFVSIVTAGFSTIMAGFGALIGSFAAVMDFPTGGAFGLTQKAADRTKAAMATIAGVDKRAQAHIAKIHKKAVDKLVVMIAGEFDLSKSLGHGNLVADEFMGKGVGTLGNVITRMEVALAAAALFVERNFEQPIAKFAAAVEKEVRAREHAEAVARLARGLKRAGSDPITGAGNAHVALMEVVMRNISRNKLGENAFRTMLTERLGKDPLQIQAVRDALQPMRRMTQTAAGRGEGQESVEATFNRLIAQAGASTDFGDRLQALSPLIEGLRGTNVALVSQLESLMTALSTLPVRMESGNLKVIQALNMVVGALGKLDPGANPGVLGPQIIQNVAVQNNMNSTRREPISGPGASSKHNSAGTGAGNQKR
jgi:TP901 family phage tail tape measure protein